MDIGDHVISISSDRMGSGADDLGSILIKGFINNIAKVSTLPKKIIFYNAGALLVTEGSPVLDSLKELEDKGVAILVCGTCADFFGIKEKVSVGEISNMPTIMESLSNASKIISP